MKEVSGPQDFHRSVLSVNKGMLRVKQPTKKIFMEANLLAGNINGIHKKQWNRKRVM